MPRFPAMAPAVAALGGSIYSALAERLAAHPGETYPLHVGDTWLDPPVGAHMEDLRSAQNPGLHRYAPPEGLPRLLDAVVARQRARVGVDTQRDHVLIAAGATGALGAMVGATIAPGEEVLCLAPYWPLIAGIVRQYHGVPVPVPLFGAAHSADEAVAIVAAHRGPRAAAIYLNTPNNPTGELLPRTWLEALVAWAAREGLWIFADEVYEDYVYRGEHVYCRALAPERTLAAHSFSKAYGMAGNRCGYVVGPPAVIAAARKIAAHTFYSTPTASQIAAARVLEGPGDAWLADARARYQAAGDAAAARLGLPPPAGGTFLFFDVAAHLGDDGLPGLLARCADHGLLVAPGPSFGPYATHIRVCFTAAPPAVVERGVDLLAQIFTAGPRAA
jgi:aspartate/methionine/tyrosine aminotransferase